MSAVIQLRRATAAAWTAANSLLAEGEFGYETDTTKMKIGDGATLWNALAYWSTGGGGGITGSGTAGTLSVFTGATAIGDSGALQVAGPVTAGEKSVGINTLAADVTTLCAAGGALVAAQTFADVAAPHAAIAVWSKDNGASMIGAGTGYDFWGTYYDVTTPAPFRLAAMFAQYYSSSPTSTAATQNGSFSVMVARHGSLGPQFMLDADAGFRWFNVAGSGLSAGEMAAYSFLPGQYADIYPPSPTTSGAHIRAARAASDPTTALHFQALMGDEATISATILDNYKWDGATGVTAFAAGTRILSISNNNTPQVVVFGDGSLCSLGKIGTSNVIAAPSYYLHISEYGVVNANTDFAALENIYFDCTMLGTETGLIFRQRAYNNGADLPIDAARISFRCDDTWATASTENGSLNFWTVSAGIMERKLGINALGALWGYCPAVYQKLTANEQTAFGCGANDEYHVSPVVNQGGLFTSAFVAAASAHNWGFAWSSLLGDEPVIASHLFDTAKHDGTGGLVAVAAGSLLLDVRNYNGSKFSVAGNGDIAWSGTATGTIDGGGA